MRRLRSFRVAAASFAVLGVATGGVLVACSRTEQLGTSTGALHGVTTADTSFAAIVDVVLGSDPGNECSGTLVAPDTILTASHCVASTALGCTKVPGRAYTQGNYHVMVSANGLASSGVDFTIDGVITHPLAESGVNFANCAADAGHTCAACNGDPPRCPNAHNPYGLEVTHDMALIHIAPNVGGDGKPHPPDLSTYPRIRVLTNMASSSAATPYSLHASVATSDFSSTTLFSVGGWGLNDVDTDAASYGGHRFIGQMRVPSPGDFGTFTAGVTGNLGNCEDPIGSDGGPLLYTGSMAWTDRLYDGGGYGPVPDNGDSGSPLLVQGGTGSTQIASLPSGEWFVLGDMWGGCGVDQAGPTDAGALQCEYAPTMLNNNGTWLDARLVDFDNDGVPDYMDNCPVVANPHQLTSPNRANANFDAELAVQQATVDAGIDGHSPVFGVDSWDYVEWWRITFPGDACDTHPTTAITAPYHFDDTNEDAGLCNVLYIHQGAGAYIDVDAGGTSCPKVETSGLKFQSWIGTPYGDAIDDAGTSVPSWCNCTLPTPQACANPSLSSAHCFIADDSTLPYSALNGSITSSGWTTMSVASTLPESVFTNEATTHQDPTPLHVGPLTSTRFNWDFRTDFPSSTSLDGMLWAHVYNFAGGSSFTAGLNNHYEPSHVELDNGTETIVIPTDILTFVPVWLKVERNIWNSAQFALFGQDSVSSALHTVTVDGTGHVNLLQDSKLTSAAQSELLNVAAGTFDILFADDLVSGAAGHSGARAALLLTGGTPEVRAALSYSGTQVDGAAATTTPGSPSPVAVRAFSSALDQLYWVQPYFISYGAALYVQDLATSFNVSATNTITSYNIVGDIPGNPVAMAWNSGANMLYILDLEYDDAIGDYTYRLVALTLYGEAHELWHTGAVSSYAPTNTFLSTGLFNQVVLGVSWDDHAEFTIFDQVGNPQGSYSTSSHTLQVPVILNGAGATLGMTGRTMIGAPTAFAGSLIDSSSFSQTLCGTAWLRTVVDTSTTNLLSFALSTCP